jgi:hypothetical protein
MIKSNKRDIHKRAAKVIEVEGGIFENLLEIDDVSMHYKFGNNLFPFILNIQNANVNVL